MDRKARIIKPQSQAELLWTQYIRLPKHWYFSGLFRYSLPPESAHFALGQQE
jgi:hypothetical protein